MTPPHGQSLELLRENLEVLHQAVSNENDATLIEESGNQHTGDYAALYELNDEIFLFHFATQSISRLYVFENVPAGLAGLKALNRNV